MRHIKFVSTEGQLHVDVPDAVLGFDHDETKVVTDDQAAILLSNAQFHDVTPNAQPAAVYADTEDED